MDTREGSENAGSGAILDDVTRPTGAIADFEGGSAPQWRCTIVWHPDPQRVGAVTRLPLTREPLTFGRGEPLFQPGPFGSLEGIAASGGHALILGDVHVSRRAFRLEPAVEGWRIERFSGSSRLRLNGREISAPGVFSDATARRGFSLALGQRILLHLQLVDREAGDSAVGHRGTARDLLGVSPAMERLRRSIADVAIGDDDVLLIGETGTGKELVARALHEASSRRGGPWVAVNMAAIPEELAAASLFGARRGAFTGAHGHQRGFFAQADQGTLFLDEVGDTPPSLQPLLLRALQEREIQVLGGATERVDLRVISATERDPDDTGLGFRRALRHRLGVQELRLPPLRERIEDVGVLAVHFFRRRGLALAGPVSPQDSPRWLRLFELLLACEWPGNVRELEHAVAQVATASVRRVEVPEPLLKRLKQADAARGAAAPGDAVAEARVDAARAGEAASGRSRLADLDEEAFLAAWRDARFEVATMARTLGVSRAAIYRRVSASRSCRLAGDVPTAELRAVLERCRGDLEKTAEQLAVSQRGLEARLRAGGDAQASVAAGRGSL